MEFAVEETQGQTRTMGIYDGSRIKFYWTEGDKLWINTDGTTLVQSAKDEINSAMTALNDTKTPDAKFYFSGLYTAESYPVRYTGNGNAHGDKVTIKSEQSQTEPNNADILVRMVTVVRLLLLERMESISLRSHTRRLT